MLGAPEAFAPRPGRRFLRGLPPQVVSLDSAPHELRLDVGELRFPAGRGNGTLPTRAYNPSIAHAPRGLCPRCAFVATMRIDSMDQCSAATSSAEASISPRARVRQLEKRQNFRETALAVLDTQLRVLDWTWYLACPEVQVSAADSQWVTDGWTVPQGVAGPFRPPWTKGVYDARLLAVGGRLLITSACRGCDGGIKWSQLQLTGDATADGGLRGLRAWAARTFISDRRHGAKRWATGRNQVLFAVERAGGGGFEMLAQPWLGMVASFGSLQWVKASLRCARSPIRPTYPNLLKLHGAYCSLFQGRWWAQWERRASWAEHQAGHDVCGPTPFGGLLTMDALLPLGPHSHPGQLGLELLANDSLNELKDTGFRLSTTANLVRVRWPRVGSGAAGCEAYLGVGHLHRGDGVLNLRRGRNSRLRRRARAGRAQDASAAAAHSQPFLFGYAYTHFFYAVEAHAPWRTVATSGEFCLAADGAPTDCESVQFISSVELQNAQTLLLAYGANDCQAKVARLSLERVWRMLRPLAARAGDACYATGAT